MLDKEPTQSNETTFAQMLLLQKLAGLTLPGSIERFEQDRMKAQTQEKTQEFSLLGEPQKEVAKSSELCASLADLLSTSGVQPSENQWVYLSEGGSLASLIYRHQGRVTGRVDVIFDETTQTATYEMRAADGKVLAVLENQMAFAGSAGRALDSLVDIAERNHNPTPAKAKVLSIER